MKRLTTLLPVLALVLAAASADAQESGTSGGRVYPPPAQGGVQSYRHASTLQEGILRGRADLIRGWGEYNYNTASAALIFEDAKKANYENQLRHAETFWAKKALYESIQAAKKAERTKLREHRLETRNLPAAFPVPQASIDPSQPGFVWPQALLRPEFAYARGQLVSLFAQRTPSNSGASSQNYWLIRNATLQMRNGLADIVREIPGGQYAEALQFIQLVGNEARQPVQIKVAAR